MTRLSAVVLGLALIGTSLSGCQGPASTKPVSGFVTDMTAFNVFVATHPTAEQFKSVYPDVMLVTPDTMTTREMRSNNSRYFPEFDKDGRIVGGKFM
jgi:hypothetical protein